MAQGGGSITVTSDANGVVEGTFNLSVVPTTGGGSGLSLMACTVAPVDGGAATGVAVM